MAANRCFCTVYQVPDAVMDQAHLQNRWLDLPAAEWSVVLVHELLDGIQDDRWKVEAALVTRSEDVDAQIQLLEGGLKSSEAVLEQDPFVRQLRESLEDAQAAREVVEQAKEQDPDVLQVLGLRIQLFELQDKAKTWQELYGHIARPTFGSGASKPAPAQVQDEEDVDASWQFDGDDDTSLSTSIEAYEGGEQDSSSSTSFPTLPDFLDTSIIQTACSAAAAAEFHTLATFFARHSFRLSSHRLSILDNVPLFSEVDDYTDVLPQVDGIKGVERLQAGKPWREIDWTELQTIREAVEPEQPRAISAPEVAKWYQRRVEAIDSETGRVDNALALVQYGASQGVPDLDALGEELSLLSKLVYDRDVAGENEGSAASAQDWTLKQWRSSSELEIVAAYLSSSTPNSVANDIRRLVLPYLYVLESQRERSGQADNTLHDRLLHQWLLSVSVTRLDLVSALFQASKPTLKPAQRLVKQDDVLARLALACVYGHPGTAAWEEMTAIFDCLPAFNETNTAIPSEQTLLSILPLSSSPPSASQIFEALGAFSLPSLSRALDAFDLHLEAAEIFARWSAPQPLRFFVGLCSDAKLQRSWADRLARTSAGAVSGRGGGLGADFEHEDEWISLLYDLCKLAGKQAEYEEGEPRPAFGYLSTAEITKIFYSGLLSSGKFNLAKSLFSPSSGERPLDPATMQELVLAASREYYDNADSANLHSGNMKLAFDCLTVASTTPEVRRERDFIEATSRLASFRVLNTAGQPLSPIEIRLTSDKLSLISRLLSSNEDAYRHPDLILDLVAKLGYRGDVLAETRALSMLADSALQANDARRAADVCDRMIKVVEQVRKGRDKEKAAQAAELAWKTCFQFGKQEEITDGEKKKELLGQALLLCPPSSISEVLTVWQVSDSQHVKQKKRTSRQLPSSASMTSSTHGGLSLPFNMPSRPTTPSSIHLPHSAESAARAALSVGRAASAYLPFRTATPDPTGSRSSSPHSPQSARTAHPTHSTSPTRDHSDLRHAVGDRLQKGFTSGIGWLIGAEEDR